MSKRKNQPIEETEDEEIEIEEISENKENPQQKTKRLLKEFKIEHKILFKNNKQ